MALVVTSLFSFLIFTYWGPLSSLINLDKNLWILFIFSKNQLLVLVIFFRLYFQSLFCCDLYFFPSTLGFVFLITLGVRLFLGDFSCFLRLLLLSAFLLEQLLLCTIHFCFIMFLFVSMYLFPLWVFSVIYWLFSSLLFSLHVFILLAVFSCNF